MNSGDDGKIVFPEIMKQLQKTFTVLKHCVNTWKETQTAAKSHLRKIGNLSEQYQCCSKVQLCDLPMKNEFPGVKDRLLYKLSEEISEEIRKLQVQSEKLCVCSERMGKQYEHCMSHYNRHSTVGDLPDITTGTALYPSISDMLEWVESSEACLRESYHCKKLVLDSFTPLQEGIVDKLEKSWLSGDTEMLRQQEDHLAYTSSFVQLKIL